MRLPRRTHACRRLGVASVSPLRPAALAGKALHSCDVSPDGARVVTGGGDGKVRIWSADALATHAAEHTSAAPKRLATLNDHVESDVNVVRWSRDGEYLASAGDDQTIILYRKFAGRGDVAFGSKGEAHNHENWRAVKVCRCAASPVAQFRLQTRSSTVVQDFMLMRLACVHEIGDARKRGARTRADKSARAQAAPARNHVARVGARQLAAPLRQPRRRLHRVGNTRWWRARRSAGPQQLCQRRRMGPDWVVRGDDGRRRLRAGLGDRELGVHRYGHSRAQAHVAAHAVLPVRCLRFVRWTGRPLLHRPPGLLEQCDHCKAHKFAGRSTCSRR
jgi:WD domain, G-beta repeat